MLVPAFAFGAKTADCVDNKLGWVYNIVMQKTVFDKEFFSVKDTLLCGQVFRYFPTGSGYTVVSADKACYAEDTEEGAAVSTDFPEYFARYFDTQRDYAGGYKKAAEFGNAFLARAAESGKGIRILRQDAEETLFSFIISQNNNIARIKGIIERLCAALGEEKKFGDFTYRTFPKAADIAQKTPDFYKTLGLGYRAEYLPAVADAIVHGFDLAAAASLETDDLKRELMTLKGVGPKVADCVILFGFGRGDSFPVDTWMEKIYREDFCGPLHDRREISRYFVSEFGEYSGVFQQYMFHLKRNG